jgi:hypothetical protein
MTEYDCDESVNAPEDGDLASCECGDNDDQHSETTRNIDHSRRALDSSYEAGS